MKQEKQIAGLYMRLSQEDERQGESLSIDNQRHILRKYAEEHGFEIHAEYIDDGVSGATFDRPQVQRLLDDAKTGVINTIIVKDLSRFGRNYIEVGQYLDYVFPAFGIRFIAIQDNVDTSNRDSGAMEMMPIMNVFNEWHAANTSKKIRSAKRALALDGVYSARKASFGYIMGTDKKRTPIIDEEAASIVRRIFEMYASGISPLHIADTFNVEGVTSPSKYALEKCGHQGRKTSMYLWSNSCIRTILNNMMYLGHLPQMQQTSVSYKNHKRYNKDKSEWIITYNNHEPIISQELWDKVHARMQSPSKGRKTKAGFVHPLSGFLYCADCGAKMKMSQNKKRGIAHYNFNCGHHMRYGKSYCFSHYITAKAIEEIVLDDIREMAKRIVLDEDEIRKEFIRHNAELADSAVKNAKKELQSKKRRIEELSRLMQVAYEDRMKGKMPEDLCMEFIQKYSDEKKTLATEIVELEAKLSETESKQQSADDFIRNIKKYLDAPELTREMCYEILDRVVIGRSPQNKDEARIIDIVYKVDISSVIRYKFRK